MSFETPSQRQARMYEEAVGKQARVRQEDLRGTRYPCCGEHIDDGHHIACSKRPDDAPIIVHPDQEALA